MTVAKQIDIRANIKKYFDMAFNGSAFSIQMLQLPQMLLLRHLCI